MSSTALFFENQVKPRLEDQFQRIKDPLSNLETNQTNSWVELYTESEASLKKRSRSRRSVRRRAQYFARQVYAIEPELFVLCSLSYTISGLPVLPGAIYNELEQWWAAKPRQQSLSKVTGTICGNLSGHSGESSSSSTIPPPLAGTGTTQHLTTRSSPTPEDSAGHDRHLIPATYSSERQKRTRDHDNHELIATTHDNTDERGERFSKHPRLESQVTGNPTLVGDCKYISFSCMRRYMVDKLPEPFRSGMETSRLWREEQEREGLSVTNCLSLYLPEKINEDTLLVIRMGYYDGFNISNILGLGDLGGSAEQRWKETCESAH